MKNLFAAMPKGEYLAAVKRKMVGPFRFLGEERITGFIAGPFFSVAHHMPYEWNRKVTSECNRAYGFVKAEDGGTSVRYICSRGLLSPFWLVFFTAFCKVCFLVCDITGAGGWILSVTISLVICGATAIDAGLTENGRTGAWEVYKFLQKPDEY